jgi:lysophospholipase L1-like esterase
VIARVIRDRHADVLSLQMGINVQGGATLSLRTFRPAIIGFVQTVRDGHPDVPIVCRSPIYSPPREQVPNAVGVTLQVARQEVEAAVDVMRAHGDANLHYVSGLDVLGSEFAHLLPDQLHPNAEGYRLMGQRYTPLLAEILGLARKIA